MAGFEFSDEIVETAVKMFVGLLVRSDGYGE